MLSFFTALLKFLSDNWNILKSAPLTFAISLGFGLVSGWLLARWSYKERLENCHSRIHVKDDDLKHRDEKITDLNNQVKALEKSKPKSSPPSIELEAQLENPPKKENLSTEDLETRSHEILIEINAAITRVEDNTRELRITKKKLLNSLRYKDLMNFKNVGLENPLQKEIQKMMPQPATKLENITSQITDLESEAISEFKEEYIRKIIEVRNILVKKSPENIDHLPIEIYIKLKTLINLKNIEKDLEKLVQYI